MNEYVITITYQTENFQSDQTLTVKRRAPSPGSAISAVSALFSALSNVRYPVANTDPQEYRPYIRIKEITAQDAP